MHDPNDLLKRAVRLSEKAEVETAPHVRERLFKMAALYRHLAESEQDLANNPLSIAAVGNLFKS